MALQATGPSERAARFLSLIGSPPIIGTLYFLCLALVVGPRSYDAVGVSWGFMLCLPSLFLLAGVRRGGLSDTELNRLEERRRFLLLPLLFGVATLAAAISLHFPIPVQTSVAGMALWLLLGSVISQYWKISLHVSGTIGLFWLCFAFFGLPALWLVWVPPAVAWSRLRLRRHDAWQVAGGAVLGSVCAWVAWLAFLH